AAPSHGAGLAILGLGTGDRRPAAAGPSAVTAVPFHSQVVFQPAWSRCARTSDWQAREARGIHEEAPSVSVSRRWPLSISSNYLQRRRSAEDRAHSLRLQLRFILPAARSRLGKKRKKRGQVHLSLRKMDLSPFSSRKMDLSPFSSPLFVPLIPDRVNRPQPFELFAATHGGQPEGPEHRCSDSERG